MLNRRTELLARAIYPPKPAFKSNGMPTSEVVRFSIMAKECLVDGGQKTEEVQAWISGLSAWHSGAKGYYFSGGRSQSSAKAVLWEVGALVIRRQRVLVCASDVAGAASEAAGASRRRL